MAVYTQVSAEVLAALLTRYDVGELVSARGIAEGVENTNYLVETTGRDGEGARFILTLYEKRVAVEDLPFFLALLDHLAAKGLPVPPAIRDRKGQAIQQVAGRPACLIRFLPGVSLSQPTPAQARSAGAALGRMHRATEDFTLTRPNDMGVDTWVGLFERCGRSLNDIAAGLYDDVGFALDDVRSAWLDALPSATIHADLFPDNVLMRGDTVTGLIDFYFACTDLRAYDLAVMHTAWCFDASGTRVDWAIGDAVIAGYRDIVTLDPAERAEMGNLARGACLRFLLSRAWDWLKTPADALVTRKDPLAYWRRYQTYDARLSHLA